MTKLIELTDKLIDDATLSGSTNDRSPSKQIEYWAAIGKISEENLDLPFASIKNILIGMEEVKTGKVSVYDFG
jgi:hypothetical protein